MAEKKSIKQKLDMFLNEQFQEILLEDVVGDRFGSYSKYIIQDRAIPDVRDGLKPVQRRVLYGMHVLKVNSTSQYKKSARIVGEVMGKYHPHGDSSIYEALVRMSQPWKMGVTLIDMHGNNGSMDGDGAAAMRYTEIRMCKNAEYLLQDIDKNTVPFIPNFDEEEIEPTVLPAKFPNLLVNGSNGIASGYATYIPTHNINEVVNATIARIDNPEMTIDDLLAIMPGPDFPTGGVIMGRDGIRDAFLTGQGSVVVRSKYNLEEMANGAQRIVITEIPYDTVKSATVKRMEQLRMDGKVPDVAEVRDESGRDGLRIAIDLKKGANADAIINYYFKNTDLQSNINYNMVSICNRKPMRLGVLPILDAYIDHQKDVITNRTNFLLNKAKKRLHIVEGFMKMYDIVSEVIATIRASKNKADSIKNLVDKFAFTEDQADAIVSMQLYRLSNQDIEELRAEFEKLKLNIEEYNKILSSEKELLRVIKNELKEMNKVLNSPRKTEIRDEAANIKIDETDLVTKEQTMVAISRDGYLKRATIKAFNASKSNGTKENDTIIYQKEVSTLDVLLMFTNLGNFIYLPTYKIPECKFKDVGAFISSIVQINPKEKIIKVFNIESFTTGESVLLATKDGSIKQTLLSDFELSRYTKPVRAMKISDGDELVSADIIKDPLEIIMVTKNSEALRYRASDVALYGTNAGGVRGITLKNDELVCAFYANKNDDFIAVTSRDTIKRVKVDKLLLTKRSRSPQPFIKRVKANPYFTVAAIKMTPNQYKENVPVYLIYKNGNDTIEAFSLKYDTADYGRALETKDDLTDIIGLAIKNPETPDKAVSADYLETPVQEDIFSVGDAPIDDGFADEKPLVTPKAKQNDFDSLLSELNNITSSFKTKDIIEKKADLSDTKDKKEEVVYKKISLFDDEND